MKTTIVIISVLAVVLVAGAGFGGYRYGVSVGKTQATNVRDQFLAQRLGQGTAAQGAAAQGTAARGQGMPTPGAGGQFVGGQGIAGRGTMGTIKEIRGNTLILSTAEKELQVEVGSDCRITATAVVPVGDLKVGERIMVGGQTSGNKMTANSITVIPDTQP